tara:strand:+ start:888 stop:1574 length:687 start_codon:yes stop_codon:yes gene_type:complete
MKEMIDIIFENSEFIIVLKPEGVSFHNDNGVASGFFNQVKEQVGGDLFSIHRLDKVTSGLMIFPRTHEAARLFGEMFSKHLIQKYYLAIASGKPKKKQGLIKGDMAKGRRGSWKLLNTNQNPALTQFFSYSLIPGKRLYVLKPLSGKTHQLRVALKSLGTPIDGDLAYAGNNDDRVYLHAYRLDFCFKGKEYDFKILPKTGVNFVSREFVDEIESIGEVDKLLWPKIP